jgi:predicted DCC family thiol-disulfide oxidoreductase YuxK
MTAVLLYDGDCGVCARSVQFVLRHEPAEHPTLRFARLAGPLGDQLRAQHAGLRHIDSMIWFDPAPHARQHVRVRSEAVLAALSYLGGRWRWLATLGALVPVSLRDRAYAWFAARRHRVARPACLLPSAEQSARFLD